MVDPSGSETDTYDAAGRVKQLTKVIGTNSYTFGYQYNAGNELTRITYPSGRVVQQSYNAVGQLCEVATSTTGCGTSSSPFASAYGYDASGKITGFTFGNGVTGTYSYSSNREQLSTLSYAKSGTALFAVNYWYQQNSTSCPTGNTIGNNGQIQCIADTVSSGRTTNYTYDSLGRLSTAVTNGSSSYAQWGLAETYDRYGNRWSQTVTAGTGPSSSITFSSSGGALTNRPDGWCFDASGNLLAKSGNCPPAAPNFVYDGENRMVGDPTAGATYVYDGNGNRVQKCLPNCTSPTSSIVYLFSGSQDIAEYDNGAAPSSPSSEFIYSGSLPGPGLLASIAAGTTTYFQSDHLSWRVSTNTAGQVVGQQGAFPFGESWYSSSGNEFVFTSYQRDAESGLDYAMARYYDNTVARFCSADPLGGQVGDPQTWNRYVYSRNDPINLTDPSGQGWLNWLELAGSLVADFFTAGATTPETADLTATLIGIQQETAGIATMDAITQVGAQTNPKGQTEQTNPEGQTDTPQQQAPPGTAQQQRINCFTIALNKQFPGIGFGHDKNDTDPREQGGHINPTDTATVPTQTAQDIQTQIQNQAQHSLIPGTRYPSGLHLPQGPTTTPVPNQPDMATISISGHVDSASPVDVATGAKHLAWDVVWGTIKQKIFHGNIDKHCPM